MTLYQTVVESLTGVRDSIAAAKADGKWTISEVMQVSGDAVRVLTRAAATLQVPGVEKKALVMEAAGQFYDDIIAPLNIPYVPGVVEVFLDAQLKPLFLALIDGLIEVILRERWEAVSLPVLPAGGAE